MKDTLIVFQNNLSIARLNIDTMELERIQDVSREYIDKNIKVPFDFYYHDKILIIANSFKQPNKNWTKNLYLCNQEIETKGKKYIYFFHYEKIKNGIIASSLNFPEFEHIRRGINI